MLEVDRNAPAFTPEVVALTPPTIYEATMAMNATQALHVAQLYDVGQDLLAQFALAGYGAKAKRLMELALDPADEGHRSDIVATNAWAEDVHTSGLIAWETPGGSLHANARVGIK
jgi:hypothetical protein